MSYASSNRICVIGLPRSGSQYISEILANYSKNVLNLLEPFTPNHFSNKIKLDRDLNIVPYYNAEIDIDEYEQLDYVLNIFKKSNDIQPIVFKLFLTDQFNVTEYKKIVDVLKHKKFSFLILKRQNIVEHILSFLISKEKNIWYNDGTKVVDKFKISNTNSIDWILKQILQFDSIVKNIGLSDGVIIRYENAIQDLEEYYGKKIVGTTRVKVTLGDSKKSIVVNYRSIVKKIKEKIRGYNG